MRVNNKKNKNYNPLQHQYLLTTRKVTYAVVNIFIQ
jgi:hypothetical protein